MISDWSLGTIETGDLAYANTTKALHTGGKICETAFSTWKTISCDVSW